MVFHRPWLESLLFALALAIGLTPELLPMVVTVTLANGARRLARRRVIVKRLAAIHDLDAMDVLCTDKTGPPICFLSRGSSSSFTDLAGEQRLSGGSRCREGARARARCRAPSRGRA